MGRKRAQGEESDFLCKSGIYPLRMEMREPTLEALFMEVVGR